ncbi:amino acid ABC transporter permease [Paenibacillus radicis (ex Xue et al. 2023)]|uniref:Amino acid ABC transporter permease n=1 Tax=Paenibacillus radicis (ex Xue et al. 2023) TaxID=2972489 RepID=A0ABT1YS88_9BACL|nr:amino acid ABC transporter permease [Paenibacillus radicis (ex Xue et al. 2023)]MCR8635877.1 amino acid ABC transporter permease [Paenibacillus radicis (ex Xue et al. 2023)]
MANFSLAFAIEKFPEVLKGVPLTLLVAVISMVLGTVIGLIIALCRIYKVPVLNKLGALYVSFVRGTPLLVQIYVVFYGTPLLIDILNKEWGWHLPFSEISPLGFALLAFTINSAAYQSEVIRGAIGTTDSGQMEAALSIGMSTSQGLLRIIAPQALVVALPNLGNIFINLIKGTSLAFAIKVIEIMAQAKIVAGDGYQYLEMYLDASLIYWVICWSCERLFAWLETRYSRHERRIAA